MKKKLAVVMALLTMFQTVSVDVLAMSEVQITEEAASDVENEIEFSDKISENKDEIYENPEKTNDESKQTESNEEEFSQDSELEFSDGEETAGVEFTDELDSQDEVQEKQETELGLQFQKVWYQYKGAEEQTEIQPRNLNDENVVILGQTPDNIWYLDFSSIRAVDTEKIGMEFNVDFQESKEIAAGEEVELLLPEQYLQWNIEEPTENADDREVTYTVEDNKLKIHFEETKKYEAGEVIGKVALCARLKLAQLSMEEGARSDISCGNTSMAALLLPAYLLPDGIEQNNAVEKNDEGITELDWEIKIGIEKSGVSLSGYGFQNQFDMDALSVKKVVGADGVEIPFETNETGIFVKLPEGNTTPYSVRVIQALNMEIPEDNVKVFTNQVILKKDDIQPPENISWNSSAEATVTGAAAKMNWDEFYSKCIQEYDTENMSEEELKNLYLVIKENYICYCKKYEEEEKQTQEYAVTDDVELEESGNLDEVGDYAKGTIGNAYIEAAVSGIGQFTIGNVEGDPAYDSDNNQKLLYGHPNPGTSETKIIVDGSEYWFEADSVEQNGNQIIARMDVGNTGIKIYETLSLVAVNESVENCVKVQYEVQNNSGESRNVGIRIMLDTMLADNDDAPFKIPGKGNVTTSATYTGSSIPKYYQVYDNLDNPTTLASGYLIIDGERRPDKVSFLNWSGISEASWNYSVSDGSWLGDSAVAVYFNPVLVGAGSSMKVATRYGTGVGKKGKATGMPAIASDECALKVVDASTGDPVEDASVTVEGTTQRSDAGGYITVKAAAVNKKDILVAKEGYENRTINEEMLGGRQYNLEIKKVGDTVPIIRSVMLGDTDLLKNQKTFTEDTSGVLDKESNKNKIYTVDIKVMADVSNCTYALYQGNSQIGKRNTTGVFSLKAMNSNKKDGTYIESLKTGERFYIKCFSRDGKSTSRQIFLKVYSPTLAFDIGGLTEATIGLFQGNKGAVKNLLMQFLADSESEFSIKDKSPLKFTVDIDPETQTLKIGLNCKKEMFEDAKARNWFNKTIHKYKSTGKKSELSSAEKKDYDTAVKRWERNKSAYKIGKFDLNGSIMGYGEFKLTDDGIAIGDFGIVGGVYADASFTNNVWIWAVPCYGTIGGEGKAELGVGGQLDFNNANTFLQKLYELLDEFNAYLGAYGEIGLGHDYGGSAALKVGGKLKAGLDYLYNFKTTYNRLALKGSLSLEAKALIWSKSFNLAEATWNIFDGYKKAKSGETSLTSVQSAEQSEDNTLEFEDYFDELMSQPTTMEPRDYQDLEVAASEQKEGDVTLTNVYTSAAPQVVTAGDKMYRFWLTDISERAAQNRTALVCSIYKDGSWGDPVILEDDGTADFAYAYAVNGTKLYVVWQDCNQIYGDRATLQDMGSGLDLTLAEIDTTRSIKDTGTIKVQSVTKDSILDQLPAVYVSGEKVYIAWNTITSSYFEDVQGNCLKYRALSDGKLGETVSVDLPEKMMSTLKLLEDNGTVKAVYCLTDWDDQLEQDSKQTYSIVLKNAAVPEKAADGSDSIQIMEIDGKSMRFWYEDGDLYYMPDGTDSVENEKRQVFKTGSPDSLTGEFSVAVKNGVPEVLWVTSTDSEDSAKKVNASAYQNGTWTEPFCVYDAMGNGTITDFMAVVDSENRMHLSWQRTDYDENGSLTASEIRDVIVDEYADIELVDIAFDDTMVSEDVDLPLTIKIKNSGNTEINSFTVCVDNEAAGEFTDQKLLPGTEKEVEVKYTIPTDEVREYYVSISAGEDQEEQNNTMSFEAGGTDITLVECGTDIQYDQEVMMLEIQNTSSIAARNVKLRLMDSQDDGALLFENNIALLEAKSSVYVSVPVSIFEDTDVAYAYLITDTEQKKTAAPMPLTYNNATFYESVASAFVIQSGNGGTVNAQNYEETYRSGDQIELQAMPDEGYVFWEWKVTSAGEDDIGIIEDEQSAETVLTMPDDPVTVTAVFRKIKKAESLKCTKEKAEIQVGDTITLDAVVNPSDASDHFVWSSKDDSVASVSRGGTVTGVSAGVTRIMVSCGECTAECEITVKDVPVEKIEMSEDVHYINGIGTTESIDLILTPENASEKIVWNSSDTEVASVDEEGNVTTKAVGETVITAVSQSKPQISVSCTVKVRAVLEDISLSSNVVNLKKGDTGNLNVSFIPMYADDISDVEWTVYDTNVAEIVSVGEHNAQAVIHAVGGGSTTVEVRCGHYTAYCSITVSVPCEKITLSNQSLKIFKGRYQTLYYSLYPSDSTENIEWSSSDASVVTVNSDGEIYGYGVGTAVVTVRTSSGVQASCSISVNDNIHTVKSVKDFQSPHSYYSNMDETWVYSAKTGEKGISVTFSSDTYVESGYDNIYIYDKNNKEIGSYTGNKLASKTIYVKGNVIKVKMKTDGSQEYYGFRVTKISVDHTVATRPAREATCFKTGLTRGTYCRICGTVLTAQKSVAKLKPTMKVSESAVRLSVRQSTNAVRVYGLAKGDYIISWSSSNSKVAAVARNGKITAKNRTGSTVIRVKLASGLYKDIKVIVQKSAVKTTSISGLKKKEKLVIGQKLKLKPIKKPVTSLEKLTYASSNKNVAAVTPAGVVIAKKAGKANITVRAGQKRFVVQISVTAPAPTGMNNIAAVKSIKKGKSFVLQPVLLPRGAQAKITYKTSNKNVATVDARGKVTARGKGTAVITITAGKAKKNCKVTVK